MTFIELIDLVKGNGELGLYLAIISPGGQPGIEDALVREIGEKGFEGPLVFQSASLGSLKALREIMPDTPRVLLIQEETAREKGFRTIVDEAKHFVQGIGPTGNLAYPKHTGYAHREGLFVHHYNVNDPWMMQLFHFFGSDGFFTRRGDLAMETLKNR